MALLLSENEADCLIPQLGKQRRCPYVSTTNAGTDPLPRERFSPMAASRREVASSMQLRDSRVYYAYRRLSANPRDCFDRQRLHVAPAQGRNEMI
jgi:hypothetical protein